MGTIMFLLQTMRVGGRVHMILRTATVAGGASDPVPPVPQPLRLVFSGWKGVMTLGLQLAAN